MKIKAIISKELSSEYDPRWVIIDEDTGRILDNAQNYGYKSAQKAYAAYSYKNRSPAQKKKDSAAKHAVHDFLRKHPDVAEEFEYIFFHAVKENREDEITPQFVHDTLAGMGYTNLPFAPKDFLKYLTF